MKLKDVAKAIRQYHDFYITPEYWARIGTICNRYTADLAYQAVSELSKDKYDSLDHLLNGVEIRCQDKSAKTDDDFFSDIISVKEIDKLMNDPNGTIQTDMQRSDNHD